MGETSQDAQWIPEAADSTKLYMYYSFYIYMYTYDKVYFVNQAQ